MMRGNYLGLTHLMISLTSSYFLYLKDGKSKRCYSSCQGEYLMLTLGFNSGAMPDK